MDNVTHALAGCLMAAATVHILERRQPQISTALRRSVYALGIVAAELPDADLAYSGEWIGMGKLGYLLHHRGHTHTLLFAVVSAIVIWALLVAARRDWRQRSTAAPLLALSFAASLSHVVLDFTNSYGVHPWWPFDNRWVYGDAVFIIEPWLWIASIGPLLFIARSVTARALLSLLLVAILAAAWRVDMTGPVVAGVLTVGAVAWIGANAVLAPGRRLTAALVAWVALETVFFAASATAKRYVTDAVGAPLRDAVLSPLPGNPFCLSALVVTEEAGFYRATRAMVAPFPQLVEAPRCRNSMRSLQQGETGERADSPAIRWGTAWSAPISELRELAASNCQVAAALRFIRVPAWSQNPNGDVTIADLRFGGRGDDSFASIVAIAGATCPRHVPPWVWPRADIIDGID